MSWFTSSPTTASPATALAQTVPSLVIVTSIRLSLSLYYLIFFAVVVVGLGFEEGFALVLV